MKRLGKSISVVLTILMVLSFLSGLNVFAEENTIIISGANGNATCVEKGTSIKMVASGVPLGKAVSWSVTGLDGSVTELAAIVPISSHACVVTVSSTQYGSFKIVATQSDAPGIKGEQIIEITGNNLKTVDDTDSSVSYVNAGSGEVWEQNNNGSCYQGTGKYVTPPEDGNYSYSEPAYVEFSFTGTGVQWIGESNFNCGIAEVYLDGVKAATIDPFTAPNNYSQFVNFSREGLSDGSHTIKVVATGLKNQASSAYPGTRVLIDAFRYYSTAPTGPAVTIASKDSVQPGEEFTVNLDINNLSQVVHAEDITVNYDTALFEYVKTEGANSNILVVEADSDAAGVVKILLANDGGLSGNAPLLKLNFKAKSLNQAAAGLIAVTEAKLGIAPLGTVIQASGSSKSITVGTIPTVDKTVLASTINSAQTLHDAAVAGSEPGQYPQAAKTALQAAIDTARLVLNSVSATQTEVNNAVTALNSAVDTFNASKITDVSADVNKDGVIDVADLALVTYYYGVDSQSGNWETAKVADLNNDGKIDISDLAYAASRMAE